MAEQRNRNRTTVYRMLRTVGLLWCMTIAALGVRAEENEGTKAVVFQVEITDEIGPKMWRMVKKSFDEAERVKADYIVVHMNTYGGMVVYADSLKSLILNSRKPVWVYIDHNAASAGALISIACDRIYMREGASIGAATVVNQTGEAMPDKYQSYMRSMIRSTAQAQGKDTVVVAGDTVVKWKRDPHIAEAMVDQTIAIEGVTDTGKIVTFTPHEAMKYGFCDGMAESVDEMLRKEHIVDYTILTYKETLMDSLIGFLINPMVQGLLIMLIIGGIYFELQTPGIGFPLLAALTGGLLYFAPLYLEGFANNPEIIIFIVGLALLILEIFVIPGFGVAGISGIACIIFSLVMAGVDEVPLEFIGDSVRVILKSLFVVISSTIIGLLLCFWGSSRLFGSKRWAFALHATQQPGEGYIGVDMAAKEMVGQIGTAVTDLRPGGKVVVSGEQYDAVALLGDYITKGTPVLVKKYQSGQLYVETIEV